VDGSRLADVNAVVAATLDMKLARGMVWALTTSATSRGFHAKIIRGKSPGEMVRLLPHLLWELSHPMILSLPEARRIEVDGDFTLDGELYDHRGRVTVGLSPFHLSLVSGEDL
jgi:hypothetical protein